MLRIKITLVFSKEAKRLTHSLSIKPEDLKTEVIKSWSAQAWGT